MISSAPGSSAPFHSTSSTPIPGKPPAQPTGSFVGGGGTVANVAQSDFWKWGLAFLLFWLIVVALHEYGGNAQSIGSGFALLVLTTVLLTQGGKAMTNAVAIFTNA